MVGLIFEMRKTDATYVVVPIMQLQPTSHSIYHLFSLNNSVYCRVRTYVLVAVTPPPAKKNKQISRRQSIIESMHLS